MTKLAYLISKMEGFGTPGAIPTTHNNPGDLRHSPHSSHTLDAPNAIGHIDTIEHGWEDLDRQLGLYAERGLTIQQAIYDMCGFTEESVTECDGNDPVAYLKFVCDGLGLPAWTLMGRALTQIQS